MRPSRRLLYLIEIVVLAVCGSAFAAGAGEPPAPPRSIYQPPQPLPRRPPGTLIWAKRVPLALNPPATVWRILYHSTNVSGRDIAVSGFAVIPQAAARGGRRAVFAWAHGSDGQADRCAPSRDIAGNLPPYGGQLVGQGMALVATDYEGLGTPGIPTPDVGVSEGHAVLDGIRTLRQLPGARRLGPVVIAGQSQGGGAALWAGELRDAYAPTVDLRGVVASAPAAQFKTIVRALGSAPYNRSLGEILWAVQGLKTAYGKRVDLRELLRERARADLRRVAHQCFAQTISDWQGKTLNDVFKHKPLSVGWFVRLIEQNSPGQRNPRVPLLLAQGGRDQVIPLSVTRQLLARYCAVGATISRRVYPGASHDGVLDADTSDVLSWIGDRLRGRPAPSDC